MRRCTAAMAAGLIWASTTGASAQEIGVAVAAEALPPAGAAYRGVGPHLFLDGRARLTCGSHGHFTSAVEPPRAVGGTVVSDYVATFVGELVLEPPLVPIAVTHPLAAIDGPDDAHLALPRLVSRRELLRRVARDQP